MSKSYSSLKNKNKQTGEETENLPDRKTLVTHLNIEWML